MWGATSALTLVLLRIITTGVSFPATYQIVVDSQLASNYRDELTAVLQERAEKSAHELYTITQRAVPPIEKIGKRHRGKGVVECLVMAETPQARIIAQDEPFILTAHGACSPDFYAEYDTYQGLSTITTTESLTPPFTKQLLQFITHQKNIQSPIDRYLWKSPTRIELDIAGKSVLITESTAVTPDFVRACEKIIASQPKRAMRIDGRFDRMIILRGKEHP